MLSIIYQQAEKAQNDSLNEGQLKQKRKALMSDVRRFSNALRADEAEELEQVINTFCTIVIFKWSWYDFGKELISHHYYFIDL